MAPASGSSSKNTDSLMSRRRPSGNDAPVALHVPVPVAEADGLVGALRCLVGRGGSPAAELLVRSAAQSSDGLPGPFEVGHCCWLPPECNTRGSFILSRFDCNPFLESHCNFSLSVSD